MYDPDTFSEAGELHVSYLEVGTYVFNMSRRNLHVPKYLPTSVQSNKALVRACT